MSESLRVLILEDNPADAELVQFELQEAGIIFAANVVMNEEEYLRGIQEYCPDLILSDYDLPKYNGALALAEARRRCPDTPFILVTGAVTEDRAIEILTQGAKDYVLKKRLQQRLVPAIRRALAEAGEHRARKHAEEELREAYNTLETQVAERVAELHESRERLSLALTSSRMGAFEWDIVQDNRKFDDYIFFLLGIKPENFSGMAEEFFRVIHPDDRQAVRDALNKAIEQNSAYETEYRAIWPDRSVHYIAARGKVQRDSIGRPLRLIGVCWDITEHKQAEEALWKSEEQFKAMFEMASIGMAQADPQTGKWLRVNQRMCEITGYSSDEMLTMRVPEITHPEDREKDWQLFQNVVNGHSPNYRMEKRYIRKDGAVVWVNVNMTVIRDVAGLPVRTIATIEDVTDRKRAEAENAKLQDRFLQSQKMESVGRLAGGVAHDFNNMLGVILGHAEMAMEQVDPTQPLRADLEEIRRAANRSAELTRQLLAFARKQTVSPKVLDLNETVPGMLKMLQRLIGEDIQLAWLPGANLWPVKVDPSQIDQILANLSVNARDAISGVGKVTIETQNIHCDETYCANHAGCVPGDYVLLAVSDDGCGMDKQIQSKLFEPFFTTKETGKVRALDWPQSMVSSHRTKASSMCTASPAKGRPSRFTCPGTSARLKRHRWRDLGNLLYLAMKPFWLWKTSLHCWSSASSCLKNRDTMCWLPRLPVKRSVWPRSTPRRFTCSLPTW